MTVKIETQIPPVPEFLPLSLYPFLPPFFALPSLFVSVSVSFCLSDVHGVSLSGSLQMHLSVFVSISCSLPRAFV